MKTVTLTQLKNNFSALMDLVKKGKTSLLVCERKTPIIKIIYAGSADDEEGEGTGLALRLERAGLVRRATVAAASLDAQVSRLRVRPKKKCADILAAVLANREEDR